MLWCKRARVGVDLLKKVGWRVLPACAWPPLLCAWPPSLTCYRPFPAILLPQSGSEKLSDEARNCSCNNNYYSDMLSSVPCASPGRQREAVGRGHRGDAGEGGQAAGLRQRQGRRGGPSATRKACKASASRGNGTSHLELSLLTWSLPSPVLLALSSLPGHVRRVLPQEAVPAAAVRQVRLGRPRALHPHAPQAAVRGAVHQQGGGRGRGRERHALG